ncbi:hypothetical protein, partial [Thermogutta sp.]|uniref:hypothetical protein n=1 Tax=Thermogutta sp. TaxID=1962930 RepID=UPI00321FCA1B
CRNNGGHGIALSDEAKPTLEGNTCEGNKQGEIVYLHTASNEQPTTSPPQTTGCLVVVLIVLACLLGTLVI